MTTTKRGTMCQVKDPKGKLVKPPSQTISCFSHDFGSCQMVLHQARFLSCKQQQQMKSSHPWHLSWLLTILSFLRCPVAAAGAAFLLTGLLAL